MIVLGRVNYLQVVKTLDFGIYLDGGVDGEILMPKRYVPEETQPGDWLDAFIYLDSEDRLLATTERPFLQANEFGFLKVTAVNTFGAFLDWGLPKDLLVPFREQRNRMEIGERYLVYVHEDAQTKRLIGTAKVDKFLDKKDPEFEPNEEVDLLIAQETDLGYKAIVDNKFWGVLYHNEVFQALRAGECLVGYIKQVREDKKIDLSLKPPGYEKIGGLAEEILEKLKNSNGFLALTDKSMPEEIYETFGISKKNFKKAVGDLYKKRLVLIQEDGIKLV